MKVKDLVEFYCSTICPVPLHIFKKGAVECVIHRDKSIVIFGTDGEFHYLYADPFKQEKEKVYYWAKRFEGDNFEDAYAVEIPEGYWVYEYSTMVNFYEFRWFETLEQAQDYYDGQKFEKDSLLFDKAILYIGNDRKDCIVYEERS